MTREELIELGLRKGDWVTVYYDIVSKDRRGREYNRYSTNEYCEFYGEEKGIVSFLLRNWASDGLEVPIDNILSIRK